MKFIQVFNSYLNPGGEESSVGRIARHLELGGHQIVRFWRASTEWTMAGGPSRLRQPFLMWNNQAVLKELRELNGRERPDAWILHNVIPVVSLGVYRLARELKVPIIQWLHNYRPLSPSGGLRAGGKMLRPDDSWIAWKETLAGSWRGRFLTCWLSLGYARCQRRGDFANVRAWIAVSEAMRQVFEEAGFARQRLFTLRHAWDIKAATFPRRDEGYFLFLGRMIEAKGVRFLLDLWRRPELKETPLVLAGEGDVGAGDGSGNPANLRPVGFVRGEEKRLIIAGCRAILFPSLWPEPLSTVAFEGYQEGKPMLSSAVGGMKEVVVEGQTGRLLEPGDAQAWLRAILELHADPEMSRRMGANGRIWLENNATASNWNRQFNVILEQLFPQRRLVSTNSIGLSETTAMAPSAD